MLEVIEKLMDALPSLKSEKKPTLSLVIGLLFGGIGLGIYFRSFVDFILLLGILIALTYSVGDAGVVAGAIVAGLYGYFRAVNSNKKL